MSGKDCETYWNFLNWFDIYTSHVVLFSPSPFLLFLLLKLYSSMFSPFPSSAIQDYVYAPTSQHWSHVCTFISTSEWFFLSTLLQYFSNMYFYQMYFSKLSFPNPHHLYIKRGSKMFSVGGSILRASKKYIQFYAIASSLYWSGKRIAGFLPFRVIQYN